MCSLISICWYDNIMLMLEGEGVENVLLGENDLEKAVAKYKSFIGIDIDSEILAVGVKWN